MPTRETIHLSPSFISTRKEENVDLLAWIKSSKGKLKLKPLSLNKNALLKASRELASVNSSVRHDRKGLIDVRKRLLEESSLVLIGENRVRSDDLGRMKWLLWYSPRHRSLLLDKDARELALFRKEQADGSRLLVLLFARPLASSL